MLSRLHSMALAGIEATGCEIEVDVASRGFANAAIVGLPDTAVKESLERVRSALRNSGYDWPKYKTVINLAPADIKKEGPAFDLPIALGMIFAGGEGTPGRAAEYLIAGELALDGRVRPIKGALSMAMLARDRHLAGLILPRENAPEAAVCDEVEVIGIGTLAEAVGFLTDRLPLEPTRVDIDEVFNSASAYDIDFAEVRGQESAKRALTIAAAGAHNVLTLGPSARHRGKWLRCNGTSVHFPDLLRIAILWCPINERNDWRSPRQNGTSFFLLRKNNVIDLVAEQMGGEAFGFPSRISSAISCSVQAILSLPA